MHACTQLFALALAIALEAWAAPPASAAANMPSAAESEAQRAHAQGACGRLGPGTGLSGDKGWVVSMIPGPHQFRMRGPGSVYVTASRQQSVDFDAGRPYYLVIEGAAPGSTLEWKPPGSGWTPIPTLFLYPVQR